MVAGSPVTYPRFMLIRGHADAVRPKPVVRRTDERCAAYNSACGEISILETIGPDNVGNQETVVGGDNIWLNNAAELVGGQNNLIIGRGYDSDPVVNRVLVLHKNHRPVEATEGIMRPRWHRDC